MKAKSTIALLLLASCSHLKPTGLYENAAVNNEENIAGYTATSIFKDQMSSEIWFTQTPSCISVSSTKGNKYNGDEAMLINWNKPGGGCSWVGLGIGWDNWSGKNFESITDKAALSFDVKAVDETYKMLPWAVGFEDFSGGQAWTGMSPNLIPGNIIDNNWKTISIPLTYFPFEGRDVDVTAIKQVIFQFEASGKILFDNVCITPWKKPEPLVARSLYAPEAKTPSDIRKGTTQTLMGDGGHRIYLGFNDKELFVYAEIEDTTPLQNTHSGKDIWNGDALEIAFSTQTGIREDRPFYYPGDKHIGIRASEKPEVFDWSENKSLVGATCSASTTSGMYVLQATIPWSALGTNPWKPGETQNVEFAIDFGNGATRLTQLRWNSYNIEGFNNIPALWGKLQIIQ
jgi:hypothetical protein